jgi:hypothetical protein
MLIILAFNHVLPGMAMALNVCYLVSVLLKIANSCWILCTDSDKHPTMLKWQSRMTFIISAIVLFFAGGVNKLISDGEFFDNATRGN